MFFPHDRHGHEEYDPTPNSKKTFFGYVSVCTATPHMYSASYFCYKGFGDVDLIYKGCITQGWRGITLKSRTNYLKAALVLKA